MSVKLDRQTRQQYHPSFPGSYLLKIVAIVMPVSDKLAFKLIKQAEIPDEETLNIDIHSEVF